MFDMEYARWLEDDNRLLTELRNGLQAALSDNEMRVMVDGYLCHYDQIFRVKSVTAKSDVFHLINGMWTSQAERCFLWIGGFRPSEIIMVINHIFYILIPLFKVYNLVLGDYML
jgi:transcription factor TGA